MTETSDPSPQSDPRFRCFEQLGHEEAFDLSVTKLLARLQDRSRQMFIDENNIFRMNHGGNWTHSARAPEPDTAMHTISAEWLISFKDIAENDLSLIGRTMLPLSEEMERQFALNMYGVVSAAAEKVGNVVDAKASTSFADSMLEMFRKIEIGGDRDGNISMPHLHVGPGMAERIAKELEGVPPELEAEIERVKAQKVEEAYARENERKAKFKRGAA
ncbi:hypothetical protein [Sphingobium sp. B2]|uniref:hypothetical protein n=1 Tax=Sphingobium sp. B2 TaxID=2583228 RepID=UPI0011A14BA9|nr:hypothetical protein [Sphingobium sp. B2]